MLGQYAINLRGPIVCEDFHCLLDFKQKDKSARILEKKPQHNSYSEWLIWCDGDTCNTPKSLANKFP